MVGQQPRNFTILYHPLCPLWPEIFPTQVSLSPEQSTLVVSVY
jgi:hypothetical protein